jgi:hypothetical protein
MMMLRRYPILGALLAQLVAAPLSLGAGLMLAGRVSPWILAFAVLGLQAGVAMVVTQALKLPVWWLLIATLFPLAMALSLTFGDLPAWPFGLAFVVLYLFFSNTARERVPLYLTNRQTAEAIAGLMHERGLAHLVDLGCGFGGVVRAVAGEGRRAVGVETAPMAYLVSAVLSRITGRGEIVRQDLWTTDLSQVDLAYAFLSPEPMPALYDKAKRQMKPGSLLVSNSFAVPDVEPAEVWELSDRRKTQLFLYVMPGQEQ